MESIPTLIEAVHEELSQHLALLRSRSPFFSALALFARLEVSERFPTAATDGVTLFFNPGFFRSIKRLDQRLGLIVHELLHAALLHPTRGGIRDPLLWNIAADIVVNGIIAESKGLALPEGGLRDPSTENHPVEEVYDLLLTEGRQDRALGELGQDLVAPQPSGDSQDLDTDSVQSHWSAAWNQARAAARAAGMGAGLSPNLERAMNSVARPQLDWRALLWRHLVRTPTDFEGFDHRFIGQGQYLEALDVESVEVRVCIDTSGSIQGQHLTLFLDELRGILGAYPHLTAHVYSLDTRLSGPWTLDSSDRGDFTTKLPLTGGGGTDFRPFFKALESSRAPSGLAVFLTDGYGTFPDRPPSVDTLWVVTPGGLPSDGFPFGSVARLVDHANAMRRNR